MAKSHFGFTMVNPFFYFFLNIDQNAPQKKFTTVTILDFMRKLLSKSI